MTLQLELTAEQELELVAMIASADAELRLLFDLIDQTYDAYEAGVFKYEDE